MSFISPVANIGFAMFVIFPFLSIDNNGCSCISSIFIWIEFCAPTLIVIAEINNAVRINSFFINSPPIKI